MAGAGRERGRGNVGQAWMGGGEGRAGRLVLGGDVPEPWDRLDCVRSVANVSELKTRAKRICGWSGKRMGGSGKRVQFVGEK